jgi:hypothetical protein
MMKPRSRNPTRVWAIPLMGLIGGFGLFGPTMSASAAGPVSGTGSASASDAATNLLPGLVVTSNSVVVTARVPYNGNPATVSVAWGDGTSSAGASGTRSGSVLVISHTYTPPSNGAAFVATLTAFSNGNSEAKGVLITPRYAVTGGTQYFAPITDCDPWYEQETEWHIEQQLRHGDTGPVFSSKQWDFNRVTLDGPYLQPLPGSEFSFEMTMADPPIIDTLPVSEVDPLQDDDLEIPSTPIHPSLGSHSVGGTIGEFAGDCDAQISLNVTVVLLTPQPPPEPVNVPNIPPPPTPPPTRPPQCPGNPRNCQEQ